MIQLGRLGSVHVGQWTTKCINYLAKNQIFNSHHTFHIHASTIIKDIPLFVTWYVFSLLGPNGYAFPIEGIVREY